MSSRRGVALVVSLIVLAVLVSVAGVAVLSLFAAPGIDVPDKAALYLKLDAPFSEVDGADVVSLFRQTPTLRATVDAIHRAKSDSRVQVLVIEPTGSGGLWAQIQELRAAIDDFKTKKPVIAFLESGGGAEYYLASVASRVVLMPAGQLDLTGLASYELFFRGALDKLGVYPDLLHIGDYKTASNTFTEKGFTPAHREMTASLNRDWSEEMVRGIAAGRHMSEADVRAAIDGGPYLAEGALRAHLVDQLAYENQLDDNAPIQGTRSIEGDQYIKAPSESAGAGTGGRIALLYAVGTMASGKSSTESGVLGSETFNQWVRKVRVDPGIRAVVVRIDSPGGSALASEVIWRELMLTRAVKPLVVSMGDVAASGGYYMAAPADTIVAEPGTLTGSIGVVTGKLVVGGSLDKIGVGTGTVTDGKMADIYSPFQKFSDAERARIEEQLQSTYELFLKRVADGRHEATSKIDAVAQGRVWTGRQARQIGLVDELGGLDDAIRIAKQRAKLDPQKNVDLVVYPPKRTFFDVLSNPFGTGAMTASSAFDLLFHRPAAEAVGSAVSLVQRFRRGEPLAIMPNVFVH